VTSSWSQFLDALSEPWPSLRAPAPLVESVLHVVSGDPSAQRLVEEGKARYANGAVSPPVSRSHPKPASTYRNRHKGVMSVDPSEETLISV
jgi:hypothetical protein